MRLAAHGIGVALPRGWEGRIYRRPGADPTLHAANFQLPATDGDFGSGATGRMPDGGALVVLKEYRSGPRLIPGTGLFESRELPIPLRPNRFHPRALQVGRPRQSGFQHFFTTATGRPFCLYAVIKTGSDRAQAASRAESQLDALNRILASLSFHPRS